MYKMLVSTFYMFWRVQMVLLIEALQWGRVLMFDSKPTGNLMFSKLPSTCKMTIKADWVKSIFMLILEISRRLLTSFVVPRPSRSSVSSRLLVTEMPSWFHETTATGTYNRCMGYTNNSFVSKIRPRWGNPVIPKLLNEMNLWNCNRLVLLSTCDFKSYSSYYVFESVI